MRPPRTMVAIQPPRESIVSIAAASGWAGVGADSAAFLLLLAAVDDLQAAASQSIRSEGRDGPRADRSACCKYKNIRKSWSGVRIDRRGRPRTRLCAFWPLPKLRAGGHLGAKVGNGLGNVRLQQASVGKAGRSVDRASIESNRPKLCQPAPCMRTARYCGGMLSDGVPGVGRSVDPSIGVGLADSHACMRSSSPNTQVTPYSRTPNSITGATDRVEASEAHAHRYAGTRTRDRSRQDGGIRRRWRRQQQRPPPAPPPRARDALPRAAQPAAPRPGGGRGLPGLPRAQRAALSVRVCVLWWCGEGASAWILIL